MNYCNGHTYVRGAWLSAQSGGGFRLFLFTLTSMKAFRGFDRATPGNLRPGDRLRARGRGHVGMFEYEINNNE